ncbi:ATP-binding cassette domain-containing protein [Kutzneria sp. NPDC052558]|uniref:ATP-binding cassette domain-containing protein n=1 Tax=Kutzneria sp. NPDC052558 TaxID=3364121 RepID=UPI0037C84204
MIRYTAAQRFTDGRQARRDAHAGLPQPGPTPLSTPYRDSLIAGAREQCEAVLLGYRAIQADYQRRWAARLAVVREAEAQLARAEAAVRDLAVRPSNAVLTKRTLGEEHRSDAIVRERRLREHAQKYLRAKELVKAARAEVDQRRRELPIGRGRLRRQAKVAGNRIRQIHRHCHRRIAEYRRVLAHSHPRAGLVAQGMDVLEPALPGWLRDEVVQLPKLPAALEALPTAESDGDRIPLRDGLVIGSCPDRADVVVAGHGIAAEHAVVRRRGDGVVLKDIGCGDRVFVGARPVRRVGLEPGVRFDIADCRFRVDEGGEYLIKTLASGYGLVVSELSSQVVTAMGVEPKLTRVSFSQPAGTVLAVLDPTRTNGLLPVLLGAMPSSGTMCFHDLNMRLNGPQIGTWTRFVPRQSRWRRGRTVRRTLERADRRLRPKGTKRERMPGPVRRVVRQFELESIVDYRMDALRSGQRKRVAIAVEVLAGPRLLLLDEPTAGLDQAGSKRIMTGLRKAASDGCTVLLTVSSMRELPFVDQVVVLGTKGRAVFSGTPEELPAALGARDDRALRELLEKSTDELARAYAAGPSAARARARAAAADQKAWQTTGADR